MDVEQASTTNEEKIHLLLLPCQEQKVDFVLKPMRKRLKILLPNNFNTQRPSKGKKRNSCFKIKGIVSFEHKHDLVYHGKFPANNCNDDYVGETGQHMAVRTMD